jgi:DNA adenine methylase
LELIEKYNRENVLMYLDPPYVREIRKHKKIYIHEMNDRDHEKMLGMLTVSKAKIVLSGYDHELYRRYLGNWKRDRIITKDEVGNRRTECLWINYDVPQ